MRFIRRWLVAASYVVVFLGSAQAQSVTIGSATVWSAGDSQDGNQMLAQIAKLTQAATIQSLSFYVNAASGNLILGIYDATGPNGGPGALKASTASFTPTKGWNTAKVVTPVSLAAGSYWLAFLPSSNALGSAIGFVGTGNCKYYSFSFGSLPSKFSTSPASCAPASWSLYATLTPSSSGGTSANGACGSSNGESLASAPTANLCGAGAASTVTGSGPWSWTCAGSSGGSTATCSATKVASAPPVNGACGSSNGGSLTSAPTANLCTAGTASTVTGSGPWSWSCAGSNSGSTATCSVSVKTASGSTGSTGAGGADPTSGVLPSYNDAYANWKNAGMQSVGGIPTRTTVCATISPLGGGKDDSTQINNAIASCPAGDVLMLAAGTFTVMEGETININKAITLRGTGACNGSTSPYCATVINEANGAVMNSYICGQSSCAYNPLILAGPPQWTTSWTPTKLTADAAQGATSVQVASATGFAVGQWVLIDEASGAAYQTDPDGYGQIWAAPDWLSSIGTPATGRVAWQKHNPSQSFDDFSSSQYPYQSGTTGCYYSFCDRPTAELHRITAINTSTYTITFDDPLTIAYRASGGHNAQLYYPSQAFVQNAGVENLTITHSFGGGSVSFQFCAYCWAKNVESTLSFQGSFNLTYAARIELNEVYSHKCAWPAPGGGGYNIDLQNATTEIYVVNSISTQCDKVITARSGGAGSVVAYNFMDDQFINGQEHWQEIGLNGSHAAGSHGMLFEGNQVSNMDSDDTHGNAIDHTFFRNWATGVRTPFTDYISGVAINDAKNLPGGNGPLRAAGVMAYTYWTAFVGDVLGTSGVTTAANGWVLNGSFTGSETGSIWLLGWQGQPPYKSDPNSTTYTFKHGNYDYYDNSVQWNAGTSNHNLPNSFYLSSAPSFFSAGSGYPWPWVTPTGSTPLQSGPSGCGGTCSALPAKARYDAGKPFVQP
jgi:hypothetical protein